jgi:glycosyltransferase involved in cell wall biosynthesis
MTTPLLTFLIPTYNRAGLLTRAIESVLVDELADRSLFEIIVVDDGSTDDTAARIAHWVAGGDIQYLRMPMNRGVAAARNAGIDAARGSWLVLLDSDNQLLPGALVRLIAELSSLSDSVGVFWGNCRDRHGHTTTTHGVTGVVPGTHLIDGRYAGEHFSVVRASLARRHKFAELGTRNECAACFWYPIALESELYLSSGVFQFYETDGDDRITSLQSRRYRAEELVKCFEETLRRFGPLLEQRAPVTFWGLHGRVALYRSIAGEWLPSVRAALGGARGWRAVPTNLGVLGICIAGPWAARIALARRPL